MWSLVSFFPLYKSYHACLVLGYELHESRDRVCNHPKHGGCFINFCWLANEHRTQNLSWRQKGSTEGCSVTTDFNFPSPVYLPCSPRFYSFLQPIPAVPPTMDCHFTANSSLILLWTTVHITSVIHLLACVCSPWTFLVTILNCLDPLCSYLIVLVIRFSNELGDKHRS
jgi:hypothetical protein